MTDLVTLSSKNQFTLPVNFVRHLGLKKGSKLWTRLENKSIVIEPVEDTWDDLKGFLADNPIAKKYTYDQVYKMAQKKEAKRLMGT